jgi:hypothetical protein
LSKIKSNIDAFSTPFQSVETKIISPLIDAQNIANDKGVLGFLLLFAVSIALAAISFILVIMYTLCKCCSFVRFFLHLIWNLIVILMILNFLLGAAFGLLGLVSLDAVPVMKFIFGSENLKSDNPLLVTGTSGKLIDICINGI